MTIRKTIIQQLTELKTSLIDRSDLKYLKFFNNIVSQNLLQTNADNLQAVLSYIFIDQIHWYNEEGYYGISMDNGLHKEKKYVQINKNEISIVESGGFHTSLIDENKLFEYGSEYYSESEYSSVWIFELVNGKLLLKRHIVAG